MRAMTIFVSVTKRMFTGRRLRNMQSKMNIEDTYLKNSWTNLDQIW